MIKEKINMELLGDDELDAITGGTKSLQVMKVACRKCKKTININSQAASVRCPICGYRNIFAG